MDLGEAGARSQVLLCSALSCFLVKPPTCPHRTPSSELHTQMEAGGVTQLQHPHVRHGKELQWFAALIRNKPLDVKIHLSTLPRGHICAPLSLRAERLGDILAPKANVTSGSETLVYLPQRGCPSSALWTRNSPTNQPSCSLAELHTHQQQRQNVLGLLRVTSGLGHLDPLLVTLLRSHNAAGMRISNGSALTGLSLRFPWLSSFADCLRQCRFV